MEAKEEFWVWLGQRLDKKRAELGKDSTGGASWRGTLKTELLEAEVIADRFAKLFGYDVGR
ncbi:hypothetical protein [Geotalea toluenoxydans]|uniref:hypothetical protein n=1 Tax=Geotalea toluenoxydans TaxID=421624 RepID=UPI0006D284E5|nr:hypothetical protein [Geotalea toluenoxydans]